MGITSSVADLPAVSRPAENSFVQPFAAVLCANSPLYRTQNAMVWVVKSQRMENETPIKIAYTYFWRSSESFFS
jgi:hypothetical protein